jgi:hypothetical protein
MSLSSKLLPTALAFGLLAAPVAVQAAEATDPVISSVSVSIDPAFAAKDAKDYGDKDVAALAERLRKAVEVSLTAKGRLAAGSASGAALQLVLVDAKPNRPTFKQMADKPGLSMQSFSVGGAEVRGEQVSPDGGRIKLGYSWYESDIRWAQGQATWSDANRAIDGFAKRVADGDAELPAKP